MNLHDSVKESPVGPGKITGFTDRGFPKVNDIAVAWLVLDSGEEFGPVPGTMAAVVEEASQNSVAAQLAKIQGLTIGDCLRFFAAKEDDPYVKAAIKAYDEEGRIEIEDPTVVSPGEDPGAYVLAWVWVADSELESVDDDDDDEEPGDDLCDLCMRSGLAIYRTTLDGRTVCSRCEDDADAIDEQCRRDRFREAIEQAFSQSSVEPELDALVENFATWSENDREFVMRWLQEVARGERTTPPDVIEEYAVRTGNRFF